MTGSVALDVVIGLVFVYTLYSLLTTTFTEFIATWINLRSAFLAKGIRRMLDDGSGTKMFSDRFFNQPLIKYLANETWLASLRAWVIRKFRGRLYIKKPSYLASQNFSKNLTETLKEAYAAKIGTSSVAKIQAALKGLTDENIVRLKTLIPKNNLLRLTEIHEIREEAQRIKALFAGAEKLSQMRANIGSDSDPDFQQKLEDLINSIKQYEETTPSISAERQAKEIINTKFISVKIDFKGKFSKAKKAEAADSTLTTLQQCDERLKKILEKIDIGKAQQIITQVDIVESALKETEVQLDVPLVDKIRQVLHDPDRKIGTSETVRHIRSLLDDANNDLQKFAALIEQWYDDTMERVTGWYKESIQVITFVVGFIIAVVFNADTIAIVNILSKDTDARDKLVQMASAYIENHPNVNAATNSRATEQKLDSLLKIKKEIEKDVAAANSVLGLGWDFPDSIRLLTRLDTSLLIRPQNKSKSQFSQADFYQVVIKHRKSKECKKVTSLNDTLSNTNSRDRLLAASRRSDRPDTLPQFCDSTRFILLTPTLTRSTVSKLLTYEDQWIAHYRLPWFVPHGSKHVVAVKGDLGAFAKTNKFKFFWGSFWGYFLTAVALSLGAPFWFDILNKLVKLRTSVRVAPTESRTDASTSSSGKQGVSVPKTVG